MQAVIQEREDRLRDQERWAEPVSMRRAVVKLLVPDRRVTT